MVDGGLPYRQSNWLQVAGSGSTMDPDLLGCISGAALGVLMPRFEWKVKAVVVIGAIPKVGSG